MSTPEQRDASHDEARAEDNTEALVAKFAGRPEWALGMCSSCQEWIHPGFMCACGAWTVRRGLLTYHAEYGIEEAHEDALEIEKLSALLRERESQILDAAHAESERAWSASLKREALLAAILLLISSIYLWLQWRAGR